MDVKDATKDFTAGERIGWRQWYMVIVLTVLYVFSVVDRQALVLLVGPIKQDLGISDTEMSLLLGISFAIFYNVLGLPAGYLVDRVNRRAIMGAGVVVWSAMTVACGLARNYTQLLIGRCGVGLGEAAVLPASYSLIRDSFPPDGRGRAFGIFTMGAFIGQAGAVLLTGALIGFIAAGGLDGVPWLGTLRNWQAVLVIVGAVGFPLSLLILTFREPVRRAAREDEGVSYREALAHLRAHWRIYVPLFVFAICFYVQAAGYGIWMATVIARNWGLRPQEIGLIFGIQLLVIGPIGAWCGGLAIDLLAKRGRNDAAPLVAVAATTFLIPLSIIAPIVSTVDQMWAVLGVQMLLAAINYPVAATILSNATPPRLMGKVSAVYLLVMALLGQGVGPTVVALASDLLFSGPRAMGYALGSVTGVFLSIGLVMMVILLRGSRRAPTTAVAAGE